LATPCASASWARLVGTVGVLALLLAGCAGTSSHAANPSTEAPLTRVASVAPEVRCELVYATPENFTHQVLYDGEICLLREPVARRLARVQQRLDKEGLVLVLLDAYRPLSAQRRMWALVPDERFVANPAKGSKHNRGASVDATLLDRTTGQRLPMPTPFDDFTAAAARTAPCQEAVRCHNRAILQEAMEAEGFVGLPSEWWHFDAPDWESYRVLDVPLSAAGK
jgi:zinc D-Ala-D-Ala dipeptidase